MGANTETLSREGELERGFICRVFFLRGDKKLTELYAEAMSYGVREEWFSDATSRVVWRASARLFSRGDFSSVTMSSIVREVAKVVRESEDAEERSVQVGSDFFAACDKYVRSADDVKGYCKLLLDAHLARKARAAIQDASSRIAAGEDVAKTISRLISEAQGILTNTGSENRLSLADIGDEVICEYTQAYHEIVEKGNYEYTPGLKLPWRKLAYSINGFGADLFIVAARPGVGKTSFALNMTRYWLDCGYKVVFNSVDMSPKGFVKRVLSEKTRISSRQMQFAKSSDFKTDIEKIKEELGWLKGLEANGNFKVLKEYDIDALKANVSILKDQGKVDVLVVDYLQLMRCRDSARIGATAKATYISNTLHEMAVDLGIPILCLSQLNRDTTKDGGRDPQLSDLRDSGAIEQDAAAVMLLFRDEKLLAKWKGTEPPVQFARKMDGSSPSLNAYCPIWCLLAKSREGDAGTRIPFVVLQNKYAWYQGDYEERGEGAFARVWDDWRHADIEKVWAANGALIKMSDRRAVEIKNINLRRAEKGLQPIGEN